MEPINRNKAGMFSCLLTILLLPGLLMPLQSSANEVVRIETDLGVIKLELFSEDAPLLPERRVYRIRPGHRRRHDGSGHHSGVGAL